MSDHAIVIGLDKYEREEWNLLAAVNDAVEFAKWVTAPGQGRATNQTLTLLLSPHQTPALPYVQATQNAIHEALTNYILRDAGKGVDRLWFFYAGHAISGSASAPDEPPVLIPPEVTNIDSYLLGGALELAKYMGALQVKEPKTQVFFVDACRGLAQSTQAFQGASVIKWNLDKLGDRVASPQSQQAVLYAATFGEQVKEIGIRGLFGRALLQGLQGLGSDLTLDPLTRRFSLGFNALTSFTQRRVRSMLADAAKAGRPLRAHEPSPSLFGTAGDLPLSSFSDRPKGKLKVFLKPLAALGQGKAGIQIYAPVGGFQLDGVREPLTDPLEWLLASGMNTFEIMAPGFQSVRQTIELSDELSVSVTLEPVSAADMPLASAAAGNGEGSLQIITNDARALVIVEDATGDSVSAGFGNEEPASLPVGPYRITVTYPGLPPVDRALLVQGGGVTVLNVAPPVAATKLVASALNKLQIAVEGGLSKPSEVFGSSTTTHIGSVLAWGASAARFSKSPYGQRLRNMHLSPVPLGISTVQVLVGDAAPGGEATFLNGVELRFGEAGAEAVTQLTSVATLQGLAREWASPVDSQRASVVFSGPFLSPLSLPVPRVPDYVTLIVLARESDGSIEVQRYLFPKDPEAAGYGEFSDRVRRSEVCARALASRVPLVKGESEAALADAGTDPLTSALFGYRLAFEGRLASIGKVEREALLRMLERAPDLPDAHVIAALAALNTEERDQHMDRALSAGLPIVADGYVAIAEWLKARAAHMKQPPPVATRAFVRGGAWALFDVASIDRDALRAAIPAEMLATSNAPWAERLRPVVAATVPIASPGQPLTATAFFVGPDLLATMGFALPDEQGWPVPEGSALPEGWRAGSEGAVMQRVVAASRNGPPDMSDLPIRLVFVATNETSPSQASPSQVQFQFSAPRVGQRVAVVAHNLADSYLDEMGRGAFGVFGDGKKAILPGEVLSVDASGSSFEYDCWTLGGSAGGPVVDLETGAIIGVHYGGNQQSAERVRGVGIPLSFLANDPMWATWHGVPLVGDPSHE